MIALFYDCETTGLPLWKEPSEDPRQPHLVQLAACLVDTDTRRTVASMDVVIQPEGWEIPQDMAAIHGITTERAHKIGVPTADALSIFLHLHDKAEFRVAHNESFDMRIIRIAMHRYDTAEGADHWKVAPAQCTQSLSTRLVNAAREGKAKTASLGEAYRHFTGTELVGGHNAMVDVQACMTVWFAIQGAAPC